MNKYIPLLAMAVTVLFSQCSPKEEKPTASEDIAPLANAIVLGQDQIKQLGIKTMSVSMDTISTTLTLTGNLICPQSAQTLITYPTSVQIDRLWVQPGQMVKAGQIIATVSDLSLIQIQEDYWNTKAELQWAESEWNRQQKLKQENATSEKSWLESKVKWEQTQSKLNAQLERLKLVGIVPNAKMEIQSSVNIKTQNAGQLTDLNVAQGQRIQPGEAICKILNIQNLWAEIALFDNHNAQSVMGQSVTIEDAQHSTSNGKIVQVDGQVSPIDHAIHAWVEIQTPNKDWKPGQSIKAEVSSSVINAIKIPKTAVVNFENKDYLFLVQDKNTFVMTAIQKVHEEGEYIWIEGNSKATNIISAGAYYALQAMKNQGE